MRLRVHVCEAKVLMFADARFSVIQVGRQSGQGFIERTCHSLRQLALLGLLLLVLTGK